VIVVGVTGPIAAGKSTVTRALGDCGAALFDADAHVWDFYQGEGLEAVSALFPGARADGRIDRARLSALALADPEALRRLESLVHPAVAERRRRFLAAAQNAGARMAAVFVTRSNSANTTSSTTIAGQVFSRPKSPPIAAMPFGRLGTR